MKKWYPCKITACPKCRSEATNMRLEEHEVELDIDGVIEFECVDCGYSWWQ
jgi:hypothetical protein